MNKDDLAKEADFLFRHEILKYALTELRMESLEKLATTQPDDIVRICGLQAQVTAIDELRERLSSYIKGAEPAVIRKGLA